MKHKGISLLGAISFAGVALSGSSAIAESHASEQHKAEGEQSLPTDYNGVWQIVDYFEVTRPEDDNPQYTEEAKRRIAYFEKYYDEAEDSPAGFCYHVGMPWTMVTRARDYPTEIYQSKDRVILFHEGMDMVRHVRLDTTDFPEGYVPSQQGYSIAHWDGGDLVIETRGLTATDEVSIHHRSEEAYVLERWHLIQTDGEPDKIEITMTIEDPVIYEAPVHARQLYVRAPEGVIVGGYNCPQTKWEDFVFATRDEREQAAAEGRDPKSMTHPGTFARD